jgi:hypothetical protein
LVHSGFITPDSDLSLRLCRTHTTQIEFPARIYNGKPRPLPLLGDRFPIMRGPLVCFLSLLFRREVQLSYETLLGYVRLGEEPQKWLRRSQEHVIPTHPLSLPHTRASLSPFLCTGSDVAFRGMISICWGWEGGGAHLLGCIHCAYSCRATFRMRGLLIVDPPLHAPPRTTAGWVPP